MKTSAIPLAKSKIATLKDMLPRYLAYYRRDLNATQIAHSNLRDNTLRSFSNRAYLSHAALVP